MKSIAPSTGGTRGAELRLSMKRPSECSGSWRGIPAGSTERRGRWGLDPSSTSSRVTGGCTWSEARRAGTWFSGRPGRRVLLRATGRCRGQSDAITSHTRGDQMRFSKTFLCLFWAGALVWAQSAQPSRSLDVPFVPTTTEAVDAMLKLADVKKTDIVYDLGCGD